MMSDERIGVEEVLRVAGLARLRMTRERAGAMRSELGAVLGHAERLMGVELAGVAPMAHAGEGESRWDEDEAVGGFDGGVIGAMAPVVVGPFIGVPKVLGDAGGGGGA